MEMENARVLVSDQKIEQMKDILPVLEQVTRNNQPLFIVTEDITGNALRPSRHIACRQLTHKCLACSYVEVAARVCSDFQCLVCVPLQPARLCFELST